MKDNGKMSRDNFVEHLTDAWENTEFKHFYPVPNKGKSATWIKVMRLNNNQFRVNCLKKAFEGYFWDRKNFMENDAKLKELSEKLIDSLSGNDHLTANKVCKSIFKWGGVERRRTKTTQWLECQIEKGKLTNSLQDMVKLIQRNEDFSLFESGPYIMNSSVTKVISLASESDHDQLIIYDGRVGAALADFVVRFEKKYDYSTGVEDELLFMWGQTQGKRTVNGKNPRDPRSDNLNFKNMFINSKYRNANHARNMALASDICRAVAHNLKISPRKLEAALFMWGYDVRSYRQSG
ncbi:MAG: hypothetical protein OXC05_00755 [Halieaceae bacterium]|nr:hypothetical protein [Halieaceae bacterium]